LRAELIPSAASSVRDAFRVGSDFWKESPYRRAEISLSCDPQRVREDLSTRSAVQVFEQAELTGVSGDIDYANRLTRCRALPAIFLDLSPIVISPEDRNKIRQVKGGRAEPSRRARDLPDPLDRR
jgi:hypothetical protein